VDKVEQEEHGLQIVFQITSYLCSRRRWWKLFTCRRIRRSGGGGAGNATPAETGVATAGTVNTGGGGGATGHPNSTGGAAGGSGIVIVRAPGSANLGASPGTNTVTTLPAPAGGCKVATFTVSGTLTT
jgi:hypothetical protein